LTWSPGIVSTTAVDTISFDGTTAQPWQQFGTSYNQGDIVVYVSGTSNCCYVYNGCCDPGQGYCPNPDLICGSGFPMPTPWGAGVPPYSDIDPYTTWTAYQNMMALGYDNTSCTGMGLPGQYVWELPLYRGLQEVSFNQLAAGGLCGAATSDIWTAGPDWIPCNQGCPV
jgi:hypothetical protein